MTYYVIDTNSIIDNLSQVVDNDYNLVITSHVLRELEYIKTYKSDDELKWKARQAQNFIKSSDRIKHDLKDYNWDINNTFDPNYVDNKILKCCIENDYGIITGDILLIEKAKGYNIPNIDLNEVDNEEDTYSGYIEVFRNEVGDITSKLMNHENAFNLISNQYLIYKEKKVFDIEGNRDYEKEIVIDVVSWNGEYYDFHVREKGFKTNTLGSFKPYDIYQRCALDSLHKNKVTMLKGKAGSGKSLIALQYAMKEIEKMNGNRYEKLIVFCNPVASKNSARLGFYKGDRTEKLMDSTTGSMLSSKFGGQYGIDTMISNEKLILLPFADIRGFDTTGMKAIVWIVEAQNLDRELMKLAIQRVGNDSKLIIDGDYKTQVDMNAYAGHRNGMRRASEIFRGKSIYGEVEFPIIYRSEMAKIADEM